MKVKGKPKLWRSLKTGNTFPYEEYVNHGYGGIHRGKKDLPHDEYPYTIDYEEIEEPEWRIRALEVWKTIKNDTAGG